MPPHFLSHARSLQTQDLSSCDLLIVLGTSLTVQPFASLVNRVPPACPRVLLNLQSVGEAAPYPGALGFDFDGRTERPGGIRDVRGLGTSDEGVLELCKALGWGDELEALRREGWEALDKEQGEGSDDEAQAREEEEERPETEGATEEGESSEAGDEVVALTAQVGGVRLEEANEVPVRPAEGVAEVQIGSDHF